MLLFKFNLNFTLKIFEEFGLVLTWMELERLGFRLIVGWDGKKEFWRLEFKYKNLGLFESGLCDEGLI